MFKLTDIKNGESLVVKNLPENTVYAFCREDFILNVQSSKEEGMNLNSYQIKLYFLGARKECS